MCFILLSITSFVLRTLPIFETPTYRLVRVYTTHNRTIVTLLQNKDQRELSSTFDIIEWICIYSFVFHCFIFFVQ